MDSSWEGTIEVAAPIDAVYRYLADLPRHREWAQSVERLELQEPGDATGIGARYVSWERQALHNDRQPHQSLAGREGVRERSIAVVRELEPNRRIAWQAHSGPRRAIRADIAFDLAPGPSGVTTITQRIALRLSFPALVLARLVLRANPSQVREKSEAQWQASLRNIKAILEHEPAPPMGRIPDPTR